MRTRMFCQVAVAAGCLAMAGWADTTLRGPMLGYVLDSRAQALRPIQGIPGAATLGAPVDLGFPVLRAAVSSRGDFALVVRAEDQALWLARLEPGGVAVAAVPGALANAERIAFNITDRAAAVYAAGRLQLLRGLPLNPEAGAIVNVSSLGAVTVLALDSEASTALLAVSDGLQGGLYRVPLPEVGDAGQTVEAQARLVAHLAAPTAVALVRQERDAVVSDAGWNRILLIQNWSGEAAVMTLAGEGQGIARPVGVEVSADGRLVFAANAASATVAVVELETGAVDLKPALEATPTRLERLQGRVTFLLNEPGEEPLLVLDNAEKAQIYFVPGGRN